MVVVLEEANASENNIGRIDDLPISWDTSAQAFLSSVPTAAAGLNSIKQREINDFFKNMKAEGLWTKCPYMFLTLLGQSEGGVNLKNPAQNLGLPASGTVATYNANGVTFLQAWNSGLSIDTTAFHGSFYNTTANPDNAGSRIGLSVNNGAMWIAGRRIGANGTGMILNANYGSWVVNRVGGVGPVITTFEAATKKCQANVDGEYTFVIRTETLPVIGSPVVWLGGTAIGANTFTLNSPIGFFTLGALLTQSELAIFSTLQTKLITALMAA